MIIIKLFLIPILIDKTAHQGFGKEQAQDLYQPL
jgi:hypothetical protein